MNVMLVEKMPSSGRFWFFKYGMAIECRWVGGELYFVRHDGKVDKFEDVLTNSDYEEIKSCGFFVVECSSAL